MVWRKNLKVSNLQIDALLKANGYYDIELTRLDPWLVVIPEVDFSENYSSVVHIIAYCILILFILFYGYDAKIVGIKAAFFMEIQKKKLVCSVLQDK